MPTYTPANSIFDGPVTNLLLVLCIWIEIVSRARAKEKKELNTFTFGAFIGRFQSDGAASIAVKGLIVCSRRLSGVNLKEVEPKRHNRVCRLLCPNSQVCVPVYEFVSIQMTALPHTGVANRLQARRPGFGNKANKDTLRSRVCRILRPSTHVYELVLIQMTALIFWLPHTGVVIDYKQDDQDSATRQTKTLQVGLC